MAASQTLPVAVLLADDPDSIECFCGSVEALAAGDIVCAPGYPTQGLACLTFEVPRDPEVYLDLIRALVDYNRFARQVVGHEVASIYEGHLRWAEKNLYGRETFQSLFALFRRGHGDCGDLVAARCSEPDAVRAAADPKLDFSHFKGDGGVAYHAVVAYPDGTTEDPSRILGMCDHES